MKSKLVVVGPRRFELAQECAGVRRNPDRLAAAVDGVFGPVEQSLLNKALDHLAQRRS